MNDPVEIFFSYAHEDEELMNDIRRQLIVEERNGRILKWHDRMIPPGADWRQQIDHRLERAAIVLLFVSPHFIESRYCYEVEGQAALRRHEKGQARVLPIILRPCLWERTPFGALQALPRDGKPVSTWPDRDEACLDVARGVLGVVDETLSRKLPESHDASATTNVTGRSEQSRWRDKIVRLMPELIAEMRKDLVENPFRREFVVLRRAWSYWAKGNELFYFYDDHPELDGKLQVLENLGLIREITYNNTKRFILNEEFVEWLSEVQTA